MVNLGAPPTTAHYVVAVSSPLLALIPYAARWPPIVVSVFLLLSAAFALGVGILGLVCRGERITKILSAMLILYAIPIAGFAYVRCSFGSCTPYIG